MNCHTTKSDEPDHCISKDRFELIKKGEQKQTFVFNGNVIEIEPADSEFRGHLPPNLVRECWRRQQILQQEKNYGIDYRRRHSEPCIRNHSEDHAEWLSSARTAMSNAIDSSPTSSEVDFDQCPDDGPLNAVWSGWLSKKSSGALKGSVLGLWQRRWFVLSVGAHQVQLAYYTEQKPTCAMVLRRTVNVCSRGGARCESSRLGGSSALLSVAEAGREGRLQLAAGSEEEAERLVSAINGALSCMGGLDLASSC